MNSQRALYQRPYFADGAALIVPFWIKMSETKFYLRVWRRFTKGWYYKQTELASISALAGDLSSKLPYYSALSRETVVEMLRRNVSRRLLGTAV